MKKTACLLAALLFCSAGLSVSAADFDYRGRCMYSWDQDRMFADEDFELFESGKQKSVDVIDWRCSAAPSPLDQSVTLVSADGKFSSRDGIMRIDGGCKLTYEISIKEPAAAGNAIGLTLAIPKDIFSWLPDKGDRVIAEFGEDGKIVMTGPFYEYLLELNTKETPFEVARIRDMRSVDWAKHTFHTELRTKNFTGGRTKIVLKVTRRLSPELSKPGPDSAFKMIPMKPYFTRPLADEVENDGKGGWVDQGTNDMRCLKPGVIHAQGVPFKIEDGAVILCGTFRPAFPEKSAKIPVNERVERLAFCHSCAWSDVMKVGFYYRIAYEDNTKIDVPVYGGLDAPDWVGPFPSMARVKCAWSGQNSEHAVAIAHFQWKNPEPKKLVKSVQIISAKSGTVPAVFAITAVRLNKATDKLVTVLNNEYARTEAQTYAFGKEKPDWYDGGLDNSQTIEEGSALDVSSLLHKPAGKYGFLKKAGDHFEFEKLPGKRAIFWGTCIRDTRREFVPAVIDRLKKSGINIVRLESFSYFFHPDCKEESERSFMLKDGSINKKRLDDFFYFFSELKKNGIYIYMNGVNTFNSDWLPGGEELHYNKIANDKFKEVIKEALTTVNPYTKLRMVDDPAFVMIEIHNEFSATYNGTVEGKSPEAQKVMQERWAKWKADHNVSDPAPLKGGPVDSNGEEGRRFYTNVQKEYLEDWYDFMRSIGVKVPISGTNLLLTAGDLVASQKMDFMEDHSYRGATVPSAGGYWIPENGSLLGGPIGGNSAMGEILHSRLDDKPIVCTEWSDVYPHPYRMEGYPIFGAFAAYQGIDGMFSFDWAGAYMANASDVLKHGPIVCLTQISDPCTWGLNQAAALAFLRGDIQQAKNKVVLKYTWEDIWQNRRQKMMAVSSMYQMARVSIRLQKDENGEEAWPYSVPGDNRFNSIVSKLKIDAGRDYIVSDTKELLRFTEPGLFIVDTPKSQWASGVLNSLGKAPLRRLSAFEVNSSMDFATITFSSLDNEPLTQSSRILLCAVGKAANTGSYFDEKGYHEGGKCPILCEPFYASVSAKAVPGKTLKVYTLEPSTGKRTGELTVTHEKGRESFNIDKSVKTMYLELVRE